jgi:hypothetical protein
VPIEDIVAVFRREATRRTPVPQAEPEDSE